MVTRKSNVTAVILVAGPQKGTRFRPLSLELPKPLFPVAGLPLVEHHIAACKKVDDVTEIILLGFYQCNETISRFVDDMKRKYVISIRYLQEYQPLGTAGGLYHFRDQITSRESSAIIVIHADIFCVLPLQQMLALFHEKNKTSQVGGCHVVLGTEVQQAPLSRSEHGNMVVNAGTSEVTHYVEKPESYVSAVINCGVYVFHPCVFQALQEIYQKRTARVVEGGGGGGNLHGNSNPPHSNNNAGFMVIGKHLFSHIAGHNTLYCHMLSGSFWGSMKSAGSAIIANRHFLASYRNNEGLLKLEENNTSGGGGGAEVVGDVYIHPTAVVDPTAKVGPNVSIGSHCVIGPGARVRESIILDGAELRENCCVLYSIIGWRCLVGAWSRVEGTLCDPDPNHPHALIANESLFHPDGKLIPSITVLGSNVVIPREVIVLNSIVLPHKELSGSYKNQIIL